MYSILKCLGILILTFLFQEIAAQSELPATDSKRKFDYYYYEAANAKAQNKYDAAFDLLQYCSEIDSTNADVNYQLGSYYSALGEKSEAMNYFRKAIKYNSSNYYYNLAYGRLCLDLKQYTEAIDVYSNLVKGHPNNTELYVLLSESYRADGDLPKAIEALNQLEQIMGMNEKISLQKFQLYTLLKQEDKAFDEIKKYIQKYPTEIKYQILLGNLYMEAGRTNDAFITYSKAKAYDPEDPYLIISMAEYYEATDNKAAAENELHTALISPKMDVETKLAILGQYVTTLQENKKDTKVATPLFDTLMLQHPQEPELNLMYGNLMMIQGNKDDARFQYQIYAEANPTNPAGWEQMLMTAFPDSVDLSINICKTAISYIPEGSQFYFYLGLSQYLKKEYTEALTSLQDGIAYVDKNNVRLLSDFYGQIGDLYFHMEKKDSAYISYDKALKYNPSNIGVLNNYSYYLSLDKKDLDKAEKMSSLTVKAEPDNPTYLDTYGWVLFQRGIYSMAKIYLGKAVEYTKEKKEELSSEVLEHYGDVLYMTDEKEKALEYWIKAKEQEKKEEEKDEPGTRKSQTLDKKIETKAYIAE
jgi:tetratricopeptide (TPR) repeat protein